MLLYCVMGAMSPVVDFELSLDPSQNLGDAVSLSVAVNSQCGEAHPCSRRRCSPSGRAACGKDLRLCQGRGQASCRDGCAHWPSLCCACVTCW